MAEIRASDFLSDRLLGARYGQREIQALLHNLDTQLVMGNISEAIYSTLRA